MHDTTCLRLSNGFRFQWEKAQDAYVLLYPEGMVTLSPSAGEIIACIDGERDVQAIVNMLQEKFDGADLRDDVIEFLSDASSQGWLCEC